MSRDDVYFLGNVVKTHGFKGELGLKLDVDEPGDYKELESVFVEINNELVPFFIDHFQINRKGLAIVKFEGVDTEEEAQMLLKSSVYLPLDLLPQLTGNQFYFHEVIGFSIVDDVHGDIGEITSINDEVAQPLMFIQSGEKEVIIPIVDPIIKSVDRDGKKMYVSAPEGLIAFYLSSDE